MLHIIEELDVTWLLAVNSLHTPWLDTAMILVSEKLVWIPLYAFLAWVTVKKLGWKNGLYALVGLVLAITLSDQTASTLLKPLFQRLRPCHEPAFIALLNLPNGCGGQFGFASSHAANSFCIAVFFNLLFFNLSRQFLWLIFMATLVCYSRVYLGAHYPGDVFVGALIGSFWGWCSFLILRKLQIENRIKKPLQL